MFLQGEGSAVCLFFTQLLSGSVLFTIPYGSFLFKALVFMKFSWIVWVDTAICVHGFALFSALCGFFLL